MTEKLAFDQLFRQGSAVHRHQRFVGALAETMQRGRHQFLADTAFAGDQHRQIQPGRLGHQPHHRVPGRAGAHHVAGGAAAHMLHLGGKAGATGFEAAFFQSPVDNDVQFRQFVGFGQVIEGSQFHRLDGGVDIGMSGQDDHLQERISLLQPAQQFQAVHARHHDIHQGDIDGASLDRRQGLVAVAGGQGLPPFSLQTLTEQFAVMGLVVDHQHPGRFTH